MIRRERWFVFTLGAILMSGQLVVGQPPDDANPPTRAVNPLRGVGSQSVEPFRVVFPQRCRDSIKNSLPVAEFAGCRPPALPPKYYFVVLRGPSRRASSIRVAQQPRSQAQSVHHHGNLVPRVPR